MIGDEPSLRLARAAVRSGCGLPDGQNLVEIFVRDRLHEQSFKAGGPCLVAIRTNRMLRQADKPWPSPMRIPGELSREWNAAIIRQIEVEEDQFRQELLRNRNRSSGRSD